MNDTQKIIVLTGPTATGKTAFAVKMAKALDGEIISADSRQVYRGLDIGSGKDTREYTLPSGELVPYHLIDIIDPAEIYSLADFMLDASKAVDSIISRKRVPLVAGGTAMYVHSLVTSYALSGGGRADSLRRTLDSETTPSLQERLRSLDAGCDVLKNEPENRYRLIRAIEKNLSGGVKSEKERLVDAAFSVPREYLVFGMYCERSVVRSRIEKRLDERLAEGMVDEAVRLHDECGVSYEKLEFFGLEYKYLSLYLQGRISYSEMRDTLLTKIRQFAKRQDTFFRKMEREGLAIHWVRHDELDCVLDCAHKFLNSEPVPPVSFRLSETFY